MFTGGNYVSAGLLAMVGHNCVLRRIWCPDRQLPRPHPNPMDMLSPTIPEKRYTESQQEAYLSLSLCRFGQRLLIRNLLAINKKKQTRYLFFNPPQSAHLPAILDAMPKGIPKKRSFIMVSLLYR